MKTTTIFCSSSSLWIILLISSLSLCSFSLVPPVDKQAAQPPVEKKKLSQKEKRQNRLYERFEKAKSSKKRLFLQKKIRKIELQQDKSIAKGMSIAGFVTSMIALVGTVLSLSPIFFGAAFFVVTLLLGIIGLALCITALVIDKKNPTKSLKGLAIAGLVISLVLLTFIILVMILFAQLRVI